MYDSRLQAAPSALPGHPTVFLNLTPLLSFQKYSFTHFPVSSNLHHHLPTPHTWTTSILRSLINKRDPSHHPSTSCINLHGFAPQLWHPHTPQLGRVTCPCSQLRPFPLVSIPVLLKVVFTLLCHQIFLSQLDHSYQDTKMWWSLPPMTSTFLMQ